MQGSNGAREQYVQVSFGETSGSRNVEYWGSSGQCFGPTSFYSLHKWFDLAQKLKNKIEPKLNLSWKKKKLEKSWRNKEKKLNKNDFYAFKNPANYGTQKKSMWEWSKGRPQHSLCPMGTAHSLLEHSSDTIFTQKQTVQIKKVPVHPIPLVWIAVVILILFLKQWNNGVNWGHNMCQMSVSSFVCFSLPEPCPWGSPARNHDQLRPLQRQSQPGNLTSSAAARQASSSPRRPVFVWRYIWGQFFHVGWSQLFRREM